LAQNHAHKQKLNPCLKGKGQSIVSLGSHKVEAFARNEIWGALNQSEDDLQAGFSAALDCPNIDIQIPANELPPLCFAAGVSQRQALLPQHIVYHRHLREDRFEVKSSPYFKPFKV
jgi:hypothetical protein